MRRKADNGTQHSDVSLTERYGNIGISAVAAAARYQGRDENAPNAESADDQNKDRSQVKAGTSAPRS
jgi:hypothetical protein